MPENTVIFKYDYKCTHNVISLICDLFSHWPVSSCKHGVITTEEEQYLIEPLKNTSSTTSSEWDLEEAQQHVIYKMSAIPSPQEPSREFSCGISGWWTIWVGLCVGGTDVKE